MENLKGLELLFLLTGKELKCKDDFLVAAFHCLMINSHKKCVGVGDEFLETDAKSGSEALPLGWNASNDVYSLRYISDSSNFQYLLKIVKAGQSLLVNVMDVKTEKVASMSVDVNKHVAENATEKFSDAYSNLAELSTNFYKEVLSQFTRKEDRSGNESQSSNPSKKKNDIIYIDDVPRKINRPAERAPFNREDRIPAVGRGDLNPFGGGFGGGMLADPGSFHIPHGPGMGRFDPSGIPIGSVPPGARFDPIGPPRGGLGFAAGPDPDHLPAPGYDDMFM